MTPHKMHNAICQNTTATNCSERTCGEILPAEVFPHDAYISQISSSAIPKGHNTTQKKGAVHELAILGNPLGGFRRADGHSRQSRSQGRGLESGHGYTHIHNSRFRMARRRSHESPAAPNGNAADLA